MILLSENKDFRYLCAPVDIAAKKIYISFTGHLCGYLNAISPDVLDWTELPVEAEILGVVGESLTEDQAREVVLDEIFGSKFISYLEFLEDLIERKGVKTKNYPKPEFNYYESAFSVPYEKKLKAWEQAEKEIQKAVIIKVKK
jgi:hypothetical protein